MTTAWAALPRRWKVLPKWAETPRPYRAMSQRKSRNATPKALKLLRPSVNDVGPLLHEVRLDPCCATHGGAFGALTARVTVAPGGSVMAAKAALP